MSLAVMQPYLFPFLGYYQLAFHCNTFVFYDDVNYIKGGYINRNFILSSGKKQLFSIPVLKASSFKKINELQFQDNLSKVVKTIEQSYKKAPNFSSVMPLIAAILNNKERNVAIASAESITIVFEYLGLKRHFCFSSELDYDREQNAEQKLFSLCKYFDSHDYCNSLGGEKLYNKSSFSNQGISLSFLKPTPQEYPQGNHAFVSNLSIIDVLMWNSKQDVINLLSQYRIV